MKITAKFVFFVILSILMQNCVKCVFNGSSESKHILLQNERYVYGSRMASYMDETVDPCEDFHRYACGNFFNVNKIENNYGRFGSFLMLHAEVQNTIHNILNEPVNASAPEADVSAKARIYYQSCLQSNLYPYKKSEIFVKLIDSLGGWPVMNVKWKSENFNWFDTICELKSYGISAIISERLYKKNHTDLRLDFFGFLKRDGFLHRPYSREYQRHKEIVKYVMGMYGIPREKAIKAFNKIIQFGQSFVGIRKVHRLSKKGRYKRMSLEELSDFMPQLNWTKFFSTSYNKEELKNLNIFVWYRNAFKHLPLLFQGKNARAAANYLITLFLYNLHKELQHKKDQKMYCIATVKKVMNPVISAMFLESKYHEKNIEDEILTLASYIRMAFRDTIKSAKWLDKNSRKGALRKLQNISIEIADSEMTLDMDDLNVKYFGLNVSSTNDFRQNYINAIRFVNQNHRTNHRTYEIEVNAYYRRKDNKLILPGGIFRRPFYYPELPKSYNFGAIGTVLAHEFTHSMDGNQIGEVWWSDEATKEFQKRALCFAEQYSAYKIDVLDRKLEGNMTLRDDIADNGGIKHGFYGYKKWFMDNQGNLDMSKQALTGLNLTDTQLFFVSFAQLWCENVKGFAAHKRLFQDMHSPAKWRIIGTLSNFDEFSNAFNCKLGSVMNPEKKCMLW